MVQNRKYSRVDTRRLKSMIVGKIGHDKAEKYFCELGRLFTARISKSEFDKICIHIIGRETLGLHNELIRSILKNACRARERPAANRGCHPIVGKEKSCLHQSGLGFPPSPRKIRSIGNHDCKFRDRPSPLGPHGKMQNVASKESAPNLQSPPELMSLGSRPPATSVEDGEEVEQMAGSPGVQSKSSVTAPLGILVDFGVTRKVLSENSRSSKFDLETCQSSGILPSTSSLKSMMEHKLEMEGIKVSMGCANLLNNALNVYLKSLIAPSMSIVPGKFVQRSRNSNAPLSLSDLRTAAELNPQMFKGNWPVQLEKLLVHSFNHNS